MPKKKSVKKVAAKPLDPVARTGFLNNAVNHKSFLVVLLLFAAATSYAIGSFVNSNNQYINSLSASVISSNEIYANVTAPQPVDRENPFVDLTEDNEAYQAILALYYRGVLGGYGDGTFKPDNKVNRAEFAKMIVEAADLDYSVLPSANLANCFGDVKDLPADWFAPAVCASKYKGWVNGYTPEQYGPSKRIVKAEGLKIILKAFGFDIPKNDKLKVVPYKDVDLQRDWFAGVAQVAKENGIVKADGLFNARYEFTRGDLAEVIYNAMLVKGLVK